MKDAKVPLTAWLPWLGGAGALALACFGAAQMRLDHFPFGALCFVAAAALLFILRDRSTEGLSNLPRPPHPRQAWEPLFVAALAVAGYFQFLHNLWDAPGAIYSEHGHINSAMTLAGGPYMAVDPSYAYWPTMYQYLGLAASKIFGHSPGSFHLPSAVVAWITLLAFYFAARAITTPVTAAGASLLWLGFHYNIEMANRSYPVGLMYLPPLLMLGCIAWALRGGGRWAWAGAGFSAALGIWGYYPGRAMPVVLAVVSGWLWLNRKRFNLTAKQLGLMWGVFILSFSPVLWNSIKHFNAYWAYGQVNSPLKQVIPGDNPLKGVAHVVEYNLVPFLKMYHLRANVDAYEDDTMGRPVLDKVAQVLFPLGLALCLLGILRAPSAYILMVLVLGMLPPLLIKMGQPPWPRRAALAYPAVFLLCAVALEQLRQAFVEGKRRLPQWLWLVCLLGLGVSVAWQGGVHYRHYAREPVVRQFMRHAGDLLRREILANQGHQVIASDRILQQGESGVLPPGISPSLRGGYWIEDFAFLEAGKPHLLGMGPYLEHALPLLLRLYPNAQVKVHRQENPKEWDWKTVYLDFFNPEVYLVRVLVDEKDIAARTGLLDLSKAQPQAGDIQAPSFGAAHAGASLRLGGTLRVDLPGQTLTAEATWPGWQVKVDGRVMRPGQGVYFQGGPRSVELQGPVPAKAKGPIGVSLLANNADMLRPTRCIAWRFQHGLDAQFWPGSATWGKGKAELSTRFLTPVFRFNRPTLPVMNSLRVQGLVRVPKDGSYGLRLDVPTPQGSVKLDGKVIWDNFSQGPSTPPVNARMNLKAGHPYRLEVDFQRNGADEIYQIFALSVLEPGAQDWIQLPYDWCSPSPGSR